jgi:hypothetical protein
VLSETEEFIPTRLLLTLSQCDRVFGKDRSNEKSLPSSMKQEPEGGDSTQPSRRLGPSPAGTVESILKWKSAKPGFQIIEVPAA